MTDVQARFTDIVRETLMEYIYSDDNLEKAGHLEKIFKTLSEIDEKFRGVDEELKNKRRQIVKLQMEVRKAACEGYRPTDGLNLFAE